LRGVVEGLAARLRSAASWLVTLALVEGGSTFIVEHGLLGGLEHGVEPAQHGHGQDHVAVFAAHVEVAQARRRRCPR
jgi:hypothetical protein